MLTIKQIEELASRPGVKRIAVENFLDTLQGMTQGNAIDNLNLDMRSYGWNAATVRAIRQGILAAKLPVQ